MFLEVRDDSSIKNSCLIICISSQTCSVHFSWDYLEAYQGLLQNLFFCPKCQGHLAYSFRWILIYSQTGCLILREFVVLKGLSHHLGGTNSREILELFLYLLIFFFSRLSNGPYAASFIQWPQQSVRYLLANAVAIFRDPVIQSWALVFPVLWLNSIVPV